MSPAHVVELVLAVAPLIGVPLLCKIDPGKLYEAEARRRRDMMQ